MCNLYIVSYNIMCKLYIVSYNIMCKLYIVSYTIMCNLYIVSYNIMCNLLSCMLHVIVQQLYQIYPSLLYVHVVGICNKIYTYLCNANLLCSQKYAFCYIVYSRIKSLSAPRYFFTYFL